MSRTALIYRVDQLPAVYAPRSLYIAKTLGSDLYDLFLSSSDGLSIERIITDSDVPAMLASQSNKANGLVTLDNQALIPINRLPEIPSSKITSSLTVDTSGNAATADRLKTPRTINGVSFNGTQNITINAVDSTARIALSEKGAANGVATLDANGLVPSAQLPSFVDDILEYNSLSLFPTTGESGKIYVAVDTGKVYRWTGSTYIQVNSSVSNADTATKLSLARSISITGDASWTVSFDGSQAVTGNLVLSDTGVTSGDYPVVSVNSKGLVIGGRNLSQTDIPNLPGSKITSTLLVDTTGNAGTATKLKTARLINGESFDGSADITISAVDTETPRVPWAYVGAPNGVAQLDNNSRIIQICNQIDGQDTDLKSNGNYVWQDLIKEFVIRANNGSGNNPSFGTVFGNMQGLLFSANTMQQVWVDFLIPHDYAMGTEVLPKIDWLPTTNGSGNVIWGIEYTIAKRDGTFSTSTTTITGSQAVSSNSAYKHMVAEIPPGSGIPATLLEPDCTIKMRIYRDATNMFDTYNANVHAWQCSLHYQVGQIGTRGRNSNFFA